jgi:hypothetical protein
MMSHGYQVQENSDPIVDVVDTATEQFSLATAPGAFLVDVIPACGVVSSSIIVRCLLIDNLSSALCAGMVPWCCVEEDCEQLDSDAV